MSETSSQNAEPTADRVVRSFWHGEFSPYEALCLASFAATGISVELFSEAPVAGLPPGVTWRNAREILDQQVTFYRNEFDGPSAPRSTPIFSGTYYSKRWAAGGSIRTSC
jgi:hypothetical protein